jgi:tryptophan-rich sensory protein
MKSKHEGTNKRWRWYHGLAFYAAVQALTFGIGALVKRAAGNADDLTEAFRFDQDFYTEQKRPRFAPPPWLFGPAWTINNLSVIYGNLRVLNMPAATPGRSAYLKLQALSWLDYVTFTALCFSLRSNINGAAITTGMYLKTLASVLIAALKMKDARVALSLATLTAWLTIASALSVLIALWNRDEFYRAGPFAKPVKVLLK